MWRTFQNLLDRQTFDFISYIFLKIQTSVEVSTSVSRLVMLFCPTERHFIDFLKIFKVTRRVTRHDVSTAHIRSSHCRRSVWSQSIQLHQRLAGSAGGDEELPPDIFRDVSWVRHLHRKSQSIISLKTSILMRPTSLVGRSNQWGGTWAESSSWNEIRRGDLRFVVVGGSWALWTCTAKKKLLVVSWLCNAGER